MMHKSNAKLIAWCVYTVGAVVLAWYLASNSRCYDLPPHMPGPPAFMCWLVLNDPTTKWAWWKENPVRAVPIDNTDAPPVN